MSTSKVVNPENLEKRFQPIDGFQWSAFERVPGRFIRVGYIEPETKNPDAVIVDFEGLGETIEQRFEFYRDAISRNRAVFTMDWMGQGGSGRYFKAQPQRRHSNGFGEDLKDGTYFINKFVLPYAKEKNKPIDIVAHSVGGHLSLRLMSDQFQETFRQAVISAPMIEMALPVNIPLKLRQPLLSIISKLSGKEKYAPGQTDWTPDKPERAIGENNNYSSDPDRSKLHRTWFEANTILRSGGPTNGWLAEAQKSIDVLRKSVANVQTPTTIFVAGQEKLVMNKPIFDLANQNPYIKIIFQKGARHEQLQERDIYRDPVLSAIWGPE